jgi:ATP-dependent Lon protease
MFITTANQLETIPAPLRDRMEMIQLSGYTEEEKLQIAKRYLVGRQIERAGLDPAKIEFGDDALILLIEGYTREAGVRSLEREIGAVCRKIAYRQAETGRRRGRRIGPKQVTEMLGRRRFLREEVGSRVGRPGVATGLAWTPVGGDVLFVEATAFPGEGGLQVTGQLGDVMKESAQAAMSYVRGNVRKLGSGISDDWFKENSVHIHVPAGAIPKDGPSAGITMAMALASLITGRPVRADTAMTGELTLTGRVLPIGGLKEKALAAQRAGITRVLAPKLNQPDLQDFPPHLIRDIEFVWVDTIDRVMREALEPADGAAPRKKPRKKGGGAARAAAPKAPARPVRRRRPPPADRPQSQL